MNHSPRQIIHRFLLWHAGVILNAAARLDLEATTVALLHWLVRGRLALDARDLIDRAEREMGE